MTGETHQGNHDPALLRRTAELAIDYLNALPDSPVQANQDVEALRAALGGPLPEAPAEPLAVIEALVRDAAPGLIALAGPRYFGFVIGGGVPAAVAADWLTSVWDQNAGLYVAGPAASVVEEVVGAWLIEMFGLPPQSSYGLVTGCQMAHFTCLGAARHAVLARAGWDAEADGLFGAPPIEVIVGGEAHATILAALQYLGIGRDRVHVAAADGQGRMRLDAFDEVLAAVPPDRPLIVCVQAGNVNTGAFDPIAAIIERTRRRAGAWVHVDGAFGLWGRLSPDTAGLLEGIELADSWATDGHKWLNVPYDSGLAFVADPMAHAAAMAPPNAPYLQYSPSGQRDEEQWVPEYSRRARGFTIYAAIRSLGRAGIREMVERCCAVAREMAVELAATPDTQVLNDVVLNQVLVRFSTPGNDRAADDRLTRAVVREIQEEGTIWLSGTTWHDLAAIRISVSNWATSLDEAEVAVAAIRRAADRARAAEARSPAGGMGAV